jgi:cysteinyl-tRNA synthetase
LIELGISLEDRDDGKALVKMIDKSILLQQKQDKMLREQEKIREKQEKQRLQELKLQEKLLKSAIKPSEMFKNAEYSSWDSNGLPLTDANGVEISKSKRKKLEKEYNAQVKLHDEYLKSQ